MVNVDDGIGEMLLRSGQRMEMRGAQQLDQQQNRRSNSRDAAFPSLAVSLERRAHHEVISRVACSDSKIPSYVVWF